MAVQSNNDFFRGIVEKLDEYRKQERLCDIKVLVEGSEFPAHRAVLAANSGFFEGLFCTGLKENMEDSVRVTELNTRVFKQLLNYMYTGKLYLMNAIIVLVVGMGENLYLKSLYNLLSKTCPRTILKRQNPLPRARQFFHIPCPSSLRDNFRIGAYLFMPADFKTIVCANTEILPLT